ncbi:DUF771 domain-containing protein [Enterococcus casseliflavus]|uniref:DUF771 domain-containing protein n=1 Tax=Enterococcus casseliflavus TaxID=37734 RepID=UPI003DA5417F
MQQLEAEILIKIPVPEEMVLVEKIRLKELEENEFAGKIFTMKDFADRSNRSSKWLKDNILYHPKLVNKLNIENGGFVYYPQSQSDRWLFNAKGLIKFIDEELGKYLGGIK